MDTSTTLTQTTQKTPKTTMKSKALWFSRHDPTPEQLKEINDILEFELVEIERGKRLGMMELTDDTHVNELLDELYILQGKTQASALFGVFPTPVLHAMHSLAKNTPSELFKLICYASWNVTRASEGQKPTFQHKCWQEIGYL